MAHVSPLGWEHIGLTGDYVWTEANLAAPLRPLREVRSMFKKLPPTEIAMEACGSSHHWGREVTALGHEVHLIPPQYVKPYGGRYHLRAPEIDP